MQRSKVLFYFVGLVSAIRESGAESFQDKKALQQYLRDKSDVNIKPLLNQSESLEVDVHIVILSIQGLDEKTQVLRSSLSLVTTWMADTLRWNESDFGGAQSTVLSPGEIWTPSLAIYNAELNKEPEYRDIKVTVSSDGHSAWTGGGSFETTCKVGTTFYPFDIQHCPVQIGEMYSTLHTFNINSHLNYIDQSFYVSNDVWDLTKTEIRIEHYPAIRHNRLVAELTLSRRPEFYILNVIAPVIMLSFMNILSFKIPSSSGERVSYCVSLFLTFMVLLGSISDSMPKVSSVSILQLYINAQLAMGMVITSLSIVLVNIANHSVHSPMPYWVKVICCLGHKRKTAPEQQDVSELKGEDKYQQETTVSALDLNQITAELDRRMFIVFMILFLVTNITFVSCFHFRE